MKFDPCTCSADKVCVACRQLEDIFDKVEREVLLELGRAVAFAAREHGIRDTPYYPGE